MCNSVGIARLRNSFSVNSVKYFDQFEPQAPVSAEQKRKTFHNLKSTIDDINKSLQNAQKCLDKNNNIKVVNMNKNKNNMFETPTKQ